MISTIIRPLLWAGWLGVTPASHGLDVHLQDLPPAPGLTPSAALEPLEGLRNTLSCGLDFLGNARNCGLSTPYDAAAPFAVTFDPLFCRLTLRFAIGELIDGLLQNWLAGAFARIGSPAVGALCWLGMLGPGQCHATAAAPLMSPAVPPNASTWTSPSASTTTATPTQQRALKAAPGRPETQETAPKPPMQPGENHHGATGLDNLIR